MVSPPIEFLFGKAAKIVSAGSHQKRCKKFIALNNQAGERGRDDGSALPRASVRRRQRMVLRLLDAAAPALVARRQADRRRVRQVAADIRDDLVGSLAR
jgi:hypothetical protein